ncbi:RagB/SusD family nutrient uptake outer membrane protein [Aquimarina algicola]|uniref:RagB/SusD family nutrient uptake outer membrane protein n=1 Tax=Aquimarina algicola TaxID=2589995 RepID=A0A504J7V4_9FLAO|nr:RagB/SusD family nutrient uptake outer membrane protein [Aquimarina algicola]TPN82241.1 RagB/SusD family nutrient uptake outer membrane protein [Aquimarina algicola]
MKNKFYKIIFGFFTLLVIANCGESDLDLRPESSFVEFFRNTEEVNQALKGTYRALQAVPLREFALTEMRSDNTESKSIEGNFGDFQKFEIDPTNEVITQYWADNYTVIFRANQVLENLEVVTNETTKNKFEGEARFLRALTHFKLTVAYGEVPLLDRTITDEDRELFGQNTVTELYTFIIGDLEKAVELLPEKTSNEEDLGRATQGAAKSLLAKVLLSVTNDGELTRDYARARTLLREVIDSDLYELEDEYRDVFYNENNDEIVFNIPYTPDNAETSQDFSFEMTEDGVRSGLNYITDNFKTTFELMDLATTPEAIRAPVLISPDNDEEVGKFISSSNAVRLSGNDWIEIRYADVLLLYAEAILAGTTATTDTEAINSYNLVRRRAGVSEIASGGLLTKEMLLNERRIELAFENQRFYDLIRFGEANTILAKFATETGVNFTPNDDLLLPKPQKEINLSEGGVRQNNGY